VYKRHLSNSMDSFKIFQITWLNFVILINWISHDMKAVRFWLVGWREQSNSLSSIKRRTQKIWHLLHSTWIMGCTYCTKRWDKHAYGWLGKILTSHQRLLWSHHFRGFIWRAYKVISDWPCEGLSISSNQFLEPADKATNMLRLD